MMVNESINKIIGSRHRLSRGIERKPSVKGECLLSYPTKPLAFSISAARIEPPAAPRTVLWCSPTNR